MKSVTGIGTGDRLPALTLPSLSAEEPVLLRTDARQATVLLALHASCRACAAFLQELAGLRQELAGWDGRVIAVLADRDAAAASIDVETDAVVLLAADPEGLLRQAGIMAPSVRIADQWGQVFVAESAGEDHDFVTAADVVDWLRYLAIQCPECEGEAL